MAYIRQFRWLLMVVLLLPIIAACGGSNAGTSSSQTTTGGAGGAATASGGASGGATTGAATQSSATMAPAATEAMTAMAAMTTTSAASSSTVTAGAMDTSTAAAAGGATTAAMDTSTAMAGSATTGAMDTSTAMAGGAAMTGGPDFSKMQVEDGATLLVNTWGDPSEQKVNQDSFDRFKKLFPKVTINYQAVPQDFQTKLKADATGGTLADVFYLDSSLMTAFAPNGILLDLTSAMKDAGVNQSDYIGQLASIFVLNNKVYGLPKDQGALALFVRNDLAQKAGIDPMSIKTWDDWKNAAAKMSSGEGNNRIYGQCTDIDSQRSTALILQNGGQLVTNNKSTFNNDKGVQAVQFWYDMYKNKVAAKKDDVGAGWCGEALAKGKVAMAMEGGWLLPFMADPKNGAANVKYTALPIPIPSGGKQASLVFTNAWAAAAKTKYPKAAAALVLYLTSAQNQKPIMQTGFALPTVKSLLNDPYFAQNPNSKTLAEAGGYGTPADFAFGGPAKKDDVLKPIGSAFERIFLGQGDVKSNLDQAAQEADQVLSAK